MQTDTPSIVNLTAEQAETYRRLHAERESLRRVLEGQLDSDPRLASANRVALICVIALFVVVNAVGAAVFGAVSFGMATSVVVAAALAAGLYTKWSEDWSAKWISSQHAKDQQRLRVVEEELLTWHSEVSAGTRADDRGHLVAGSKNAYTVARHRGGQPIELTWLRSIEDGQNLEFLVTEKGSVQRAELVDSSTGTTVQP